MTWYSKLPKVELHVHLEGAIPHGALFDLIQKYGGEPSLPDVTALARRFEYKNFAQFIEVWSWKNQFLREYEDFSHIAELTARNMANQSICYAEMFFSPSLFVRHGLEVQELTHVVRIGLSRVPEIETSLIADLVRDYGPESEMTTLKKLNEVKGDGVIGIGLGGSEHEFPPGPFKSLYEKARMMDFHVTVHVQVKHQGQRAFGVPSGTFMLTGLDTGPELTKIQNSWTTFENTEFPLSYVLCQTSAQELSAPSQSTQFGNISNAG